MASFQKTPSLGSITGMLTFAAGVLIFTYLLSQWTTTRGIMGVSKGALPTT